MDKRLNLIDKGKIVRVLISAIALSSLLILLVPACSNESRYELKETTSKKVEFLEDFDKGILNPEEWQITREGDFADISPLNTLR